MFEFILQSHSQLLIALLVCIVVMLLSFLELRLPLLGCLWVSYLNFLDYHGTIFIRNFGADPYCIKHHLVIEGTADCTHEWHWRNMSTCLH